MRNGARWSAALVIAAVGAFGLGVGQAWAAEGDGFVDENYNGFREVIGEGADAYWSVQVHRSGSYIATWERDEGTWDTPEQALEQINTARQCIAGLQLAFLQQFPDHDQFTDHPSVSRTIEPDGTYTWKFTEGSAEEQQYQACSQGQEWTTDQVTLVETDDPQVQEIHIPLHVIGPGVHDIFFAPLDSPKEHRHDYPNGAWTGYVSMYELGEVSRITVAVPEANTTTFPFTGQVEKGALTDPSVLAQVGPRFADGVDVPTALGAAALPVLGGGLLLAALVGVPTLLLEAGARRNSSAVGAFMRGRLTRARKADATGGGGHDD